MASEPKPRLGDYYAGIGDDAADWFSLSSRFHRIAPTKQQKRIFVFAEGLFTNDNCDYELSFEDFAVASDAIGFGARKYEVGGWRTLTSDDHLQGAGRHFKAWLDDPQSRDDEPDENGNPGSNLLHEAHFLARAIMCLEMRRVESGRL